MQYPDTTTHPYDIEWTSPSPDASGSMPLGNGSTALNVWVEPSGDLCFTVGRTDTWGEFGQLYKVGKVRLKLASGTGPLLAHDELFSWRLLLNEGAILIRSSRGWLRIWVDALHPVIQVQAEGASPFTATVQLELWRKERRELTGKERHGLHANAPYSVYHEADEIPSIDGDRITWFHHNNSSSWRACLEQQGLLEFGESETDPLLHRTFGGIVQGEGLKKTADDSLKSRQPAHSFHCSVTLHTGRHVDPAEWVRDIQDLAARMPDAVDSPAWQAHLAWWRAFWKRSQLEIDGSEAARKVSRGYALQRFMNACAGRGEFPIKFNGSLFTVDWNFPGEAFDLDYRRWGPAYWHQNTRLPYWAMLYAGDFDMMRPYFEMYRRALPLARFRCRKFCGHEGAFFPETMYFWGCYIEQNYGWPGDRDPELAGHLSQNQYIRRHNSSGLEVVYHALLFFKFTGDDAFLRETALPLAEAVLDYYDLHFPRKDGQLHISPAQVIEQWWIAENPLPEIAGLQACLKELLSLPAGLSSRQKDWQRLANEIPPLPTHRIDNKAVFSPAQTWEGPPRNSENPELYAVFPYHLCGLGTPDLQTGIETFHRREHTHDKGWAQDGMQAALLGLTEDARYSVINRLSTPSPYARFPAFWGPGFDWIPDQDQGGSASHALQLMALQFAGATPQKLPAWPEDWSLNGILRGPDNAIIELAHAPRNA